MTINWLGIGIGRGGAGRIARRSVHDQTFGALRLIAALCALAAAALVGSGAAQAGPSPSFAPGASAAAESAAGADASQIAQVIPGQTPGAPLSPFGAPFVTSSPEEAEAPEAGAPSGDSALEETLKRALAEGRQVIIAPSGDPVLDYERLGRQVAPQTSDYSALAEGYAVEGTMLDRTQTGFAAFHQKLMEKLSAAAQVWTVLGETLSSASPNGDPLYFLWVFLIVAIGLAIGHVVETFYYAYRVVGPWFVAQQVEHPEGYVEKLPILVLRVALTLGGIAISCLTALLLGLIFYESDEATQKTALVLLAAFAAIRASRAVWRMILAPYLPNYRIPALDDEQAKTLNLWLWLATASVILSFAIAIWLSAMGLPKDVFAVTQSVVSLCAVLFNLAMIRANKETISTAILGGASVENGSLFGRIGAALWAPCASLYFILAWAEMAYQLIMDQPIQFPLIVGAYVVVLAVILVYASVSYLIEWVFRRRRAALPLAAGEGGVARPAAPRAVFAGADAEDEDLFEDGGGGSVNPAAEIDEAPTWSTRRGYRMRTMEDLARRVASIIALGAGFYALLYTWDGQNLMAESTLLSSAIDLGVTILIGYVAYHSARIAIDQRIEEEGGFDVAVEPGDEGGGHAAASRMATLLPLFRNFLLVTIAIITLLMMLLEAGVNVTPLFAGAGVIGLAIGFGAQTLVRDIFSGAFFLIDDAFRKGEYIDLGTVKGTVEKISVRSFQLRHHLGYLHTIPFGEIQYLTNYSRDWVMMKLPLRLTYDTDVERVRKLIKDLGKQLQTDPEIGEKFLQPLKSQGVYMMEESAMIIRVKFMTKPGEQWVIRKKVYAAIRELFEREGIKFAHREVTVHLAGEPAERLSDQEKTQIAGAVRPILDPPEPAPEMAVQNDR